MLAAKNFLQNRLGLPEPVVLREQPNLGKTLIEKFEDNANATNGAVVLLTPDDIYRSEGADEQFRRARQNVMLELRSFLRHFGRGSGKVLMLYIGPLDIPSDVRGIAYIDISNGVDAASEDIRRELGLS